MSAGPGSRESPRGWSPPLVGAALGATAGFLARDLVIDSLASFWVPTAILGAVLWVTRLRLLLVAATAGLLALWLAVAFTPLSARLAQGLSRRDPEGHGDAVLVLASRIQSDGEPTGPALSRLLHGLELLGQGLAPRLLLTEKAAPAPSYSTLAVRMMGRLGLAQEVVSVGPVRTTRDEAVRVTALCREKGWRRLLVVTSPTHSRRACAAVEQEGVEVICSPAVETEFDLETLDRPVDRLAAFRATLHEWLGIWLYQRRGWLKAATGTAGQGPI